MYFWNDSLIWFTRGNSWKFNFLTIQNVKSQMIYITIFSLLITRHIHVFVILIQNHYIRKFNILKYNVNISSLYVWFMENQLTDEIQCKLPFSFSLKHRHISKTVYALYSPYEQLPFFILSSLHSRWYGSFLSLLRYNFRHCSLSAREYDGTENGCRLQLVLT